MGGSKEVTVGYRYSFGIHMGIGRGPVDELVEIRVGDRVAWRGSCADSGTVDITKPDLFGGDEAEGGVVGTLDVMMGEPSQPVNSRLKAMIGGLVPAFRGVFSLFFDGQISAMNPYPKPWKVRYRRIKEGWDGVCWYPSKALIDVADGKVHAMNPAHILLACQTDRRWGLGRSGARIDYQSYAEAADRLFDERFGLCLLWTRKEAVSSFSQHVIDHIGGAQFISRRTGLMTLRLIRDDYVPEDLPLFTYNTGLLSIDEDTLSTGEAIPNEVVVNWRDPITNEDRTAREQNLGAIQAAGTVISTSVDYPGLPTHSLASRVAQREIRAKRGVRKFKVRLDRRGTALEPGAVFRISAPYDGIEQIVLRVGRIDAGTVNDAAITVTALLDVFGLPSNVYTEQQPSTWQPPNRTAQPALYQRLMEISWRDLVRRTTEAQRGGVALDASFLGALGVRPTGLSLSYALTTRVGAGAFEKRDIGDWVPTAVLDAKIGPEETVITLSAGIDLDLVKPGRAALIGEEIVRVDSLNTDTMQVGLSRGCVDTVPVWHPSGRRIWFYDNYAAGDPTEYVAGESVDAKLISRTTGERLDPALATTMSLLLDQRQGRPYPPGNLLINSVRYPSEIVGELTVVWAHRDRLLQDDRLIGTLEGSIGPEPGTTYSVRVWGEAGTLIHSQDGIEGTEFNYATEREDSNLETVTEPSPAPEFILLGDDQTDYHAREIDAPWWAPGSALHHQFHIAGFDGQRWIATLGPIWPVSAYGSAQLCPTSVLTSPDGATWTGLGRYQRPYDPAETHLFVAGSQYYRVAFDGPASTAEARLMVSSDLVTWSPVLGGPTLWQWQKYIDSWVWVENGALCAGEIVNAGNDHLFRKWTLAGGSWSYSDSAALPSVVRSDWPWARAYDGFYEVVEHGGYWYVNFAETPASGANDGNQMYRTADWATFERIPLGVNADRKYTADHVVTLQGELYVRCGIRPDPPQQGTNFIFSYRQVVGGAWQVVTWPLSNLTSVADQWYEHDGYVYYRHVNEFDAQIYRTSDMQTEEAAPPGTPWAPGCIEHAGVVFIPPQPTMIGGSATVVYSPWKRWLGQSDTPAAPAIVLPSSSATVENGKSWAAIVDPMLVQAPLDYADQEWDWGLIAGPEITTPWPFSGASGVNGFNGVVTLMAELIPGGGSVVAWCSGTGSVGAAVGCWLDTDAQRLVVRHPAVNQGDSTWPLALDPDTAYTVTLQFTEMSSVEGSWVAYHLNVTVVDDGGATVLSEAVDVDVYDSTNAWMTSDVWRAAIGGEGRWGSISMTMVKGDAVVQRLNQWLRIKLWSERDGIASLQAHDIAVARPDV